MNNLTRQALEAEILNDLNWHFRKVNNLVKTIKLVPDIYNVARFSFDLINNLRIRIPWKEDEYRRIRGVLENAGWEETYSSEYADQGSRVHSFRHEDAPENVVIVLDSTVKGSVCKRVKVGTKEVDDFIMECSHQVEFMEESGVLGD